jgi:hypothetical protein
VPLGRRGLTVALGSSRGRIDVAAHGLAVIVYNGRNVHNVPAYKYAMGNDTFLWRSDRANTPLLFVNTLPNSNGVQGYFEFDAVTPNVPIDESQFKLPLMCKASIKCPGT